MFKKGPDIDKKKLLQKALDVKRDSLSRLKYFKTLFEHLENNEVVSLFRTHFSFIYHTFIDAFSSLDTLPKIKPEDLDCTLYMLEKILVYNTELIRKRWQFCSITNVMQRLLHINNTPRLRHEGVRLFVIWYLILADDSNLELQSMFGAIIPNIVPPSALQDGSLQVACSPTDPNKKVDDLMRVGGSFNKNLSQNQLETNKAYVPRSPNDPPLHDETSFYLGSLLQFLVTQMTKPYWGSPDEAIERQKLSFSFLFNMFKKIYLVHIFPDNDLAHICALGDTYVKPSVSQYIHEVSSQMRPWGRTTDMHKLSSYGDHRQASSEHGSVRLNQQVSNANDIMQSTLRQNMTESEQLSIYQATVIKWLTRILRQDTIPGQDELIRSSGSAERRANESASPGHDRDLAHLNDVNSTAMFQHMETSSIEMEIARHVIGTWPENIVVVHDLFRKSFSNFYQLGSMKRVVNVYKEWICSGGPNNKPSKQAKIGYISFGELLQLFALNSSHAFVSQTNNPTMLEDQVEVCKRIMNIYRYMVMKIYMNTSTWEQLLNVMLSVSEHLFSMNPPKKKELTLGGRIAPAFFQTLIVSWIRANLYVPIGSKMWADFHRVMRNLVAWRELLEEWSTTMVALTRVLVKHVYGLSLLELPLDKVPGRSRSRPQIKGLSTVADSLQPVMTSPKSAKLAAKTKSYDVADTSSAAQSQKRSQADEVSIAPSRTSRSGSMRLPSSMLSALSVGLARSNSDGFLCVTNAKFAYYSSATMTHRGEFKTQQQVSSSSARTHSNQLASSRRFKSEYHISVNYQEDLPNYDRSHSPMHSHTDVIDGSSLRDPLDHDPNMAQIDSASSSATSNSAPIGHQRSQNKGQDNLQRPSNSGNQDKCVLLGGSVRGWTKENSVVMWRRMLGLFGNINHMEDPDNHLIAMKCVESLLRDFLKARDNIGISLNNRSTPELPQLVPPYTYTAGWLLEATHLPRNFQESRLIAYKLLCMMFIRRHDAELSHQLYSAFYEAIHRGLASSDVQIHSSIIENSSQIFTLEVPGSTFLAQGLFERSRALLLNFYDTQDIEVSSSSNLPQKEAVAILSSILALNRPIKKLMVLKPDASNLFNLVLPGDIRSKVFETLLACGSRGVVLDHNARSRALHSMAIYVHQELSDKFDSLDVERLFDIILVEMQDLAQQNSQSFRIHCDLLRLFTDHASLLCQSRPGLISSMLQTLCQLALRVSDNESRKEWLFCLIICLEDWCMVLNKSFLLSPLESLHAHTDNIERDNICSDTISTTATSDSLMTILLRYLDLIASGEQDFEDSTREHRTLSATGNRNATDASSGNHSYNAVERASTYSGGDVLTDNPNKSSNKDPQYHNSRSAHAAESKNKRAMKLACQVTRQKLITYLGQFPLRHVGAASMSSCANECDFLNPSSCADTSYDMSEADLANLCILVINRDTIISFIGSDIGKINKRPQDTMLDSVSVNLIFRNVCGKYSWEATCMNVEPNIGADEQLSDDVKAMQNTIVLDPDVFKQYEPQGSRVAMKYDSDFNGEDGTNSSSSLSSRSSTNRDYIGDLLAQLSSMIVSTNNSGSINSSTTSQQSGSGYKKRNSVQSIANPRYKVAQAEETMIALLTNQRFQELNYCEQSDDIDRVVLRFGCQTTHAKSHSVHTPGEDCPESLDLRNTQNSSTNKRLSFEQSRQLIQHLGYLAWDKRQKVDSLSRNARLLRELKNLDAQPTRETHKIAVIYVAQGQEDKTSILTNSTGSRAFEEFVSSLGWEVNLSSHLGFMGGLQSNKSTGESSNYYCNSSTEIMFHVSTRIPVQSAADEESLNRKLRHLGNDEVHIIWSEHTRDYRRGIIPTEFGDVIIAIYPMLTFQGYYRVQILSKQDVPSFGPLFDNCIVHQTSLASLVRATAVNASRAKRLKLPYYQSPFEERIRLIDTIVEHHREKLSFEDFTVQLFKSNTSISPISR